MMKIALACAEIRDEDMNFHLDEVERMAVLAQEQGVDFLIFGESYLQGFEALTWNPEEDREIAKPLYSTKITRLKEIASTYGMAISIGFFEREEGVFYSSNLVIGQDGEIVDRFRRVSPGWKIADAPDVYKQGKGFHTFGLGDKTFATAIGKDLWFEENIQALRDLDMDALIWPVYVDFSVGQWLSQELADYVDQSAKLPCPVLWVNSYVEDPKRAKGGAYVFHNKGVLHNIPLGNKGLLVCEI